MIESEPDRETLYKRLHEAALLERAITQSKTGPSQAAFVEAARERLREQGIDDADVFLTPEDAIEAQK